MPRPVYPTKEGIWSKGTRKEAGYAGVRLGMPYPEAVEQFRKSIEGRDDFDPAVLFAWGTMQATAVLNILKAAEETFGKAGQELVRKAVNRAGYEAMESLLKTSSFPEDIDEMEMASYVVTGINTVLYASLEKPCGLGDVHQQVNNSSNQTEIADENRAFQGHGVRGKDFLSEQIQCSYIHNAGRSQLINL